MATLNDVAKKAGVSLATASRALNGAPGRKVRPELYDRVQAAASELNYRPHAAAQTMARGHSNCIGLLVNNIADPYFAATAGGVSQVASQHGCVVMLSDTGERATNKIELVNSFAAQRVRALIMVGGISQHDPALPELAETLKQLGDSGIRVATIGTDFDQIPSVQLPNRKAAKELINELYALGYRRFALLAGPADQNVAIARADAMTKQIRELGGELTAKIHTPFDRKAAHDVVSSLLASRLPDVIVCTSDQLALGALRRLREANVSVPNQLAVSGFGDIETLEDIVPALTSVAIDAREAGQAATELVLSDNDEPRRISVGFQVKLRESTNRPK